MSIVVCPFYVKIFSNIHPKGGESDFQLSSDTETKFMKGISTALCRGSLILCCKTNAQCPAGW